MKLITRYFLRGLLVFVPAALTIFAIIYAFTKLDVLLRDLLSISIPGLGLAVTIIGITVIGFITSNILGRKMFGVMDIIFAKMPLVKMLYSSLKDLVEAFAGEKKKFDKPVVVQLVPDGPSAVGFITRESLDFLGLAGRVAVYLPQSYNFAGSVLIFPADKVKPLAIDSSEAMTFIVSGGISGGAQPAEQGLPQ